MNFYVFKHLTNNKDLFVKKLKVKSLNFMIVNSQIFWAKSMSIIVICLTNKIIRLENVIYTFKYYANLIFLD